MTQISPRSSLIPPVKNEHHKKQPIRSQNRRSSHVTRDKKIRSGNHSNMVIKEETVQIPWNSDDSLDKLTYHHPVYTSRDHVISPNHVTEEQLKRNNVLSDGLALINKNNITPLHNWDVIQPIPPSTQTSPSTQISPSAQTTPSTQTSPSTQTVPSAQISPTEKQGSTADHYSTPLSYEGSDWGVLGGVVGGVSQLGGKRRRVASVVVESYVVLTYNNREQDAQILRSVLLPF